MNLVIWNAKKKTKALKLNQARNMKIYFSYKTLRQVR